MISTVINQELGLEFPLFQGGMAWVADASLAAGVSNAGGLGIIAAMNSNGEQLRAEIKKCKELTDKPFGVNIMLMSPFAADIARLASKNKNFPLRMTSKILSKSLIVVKVIHLMLKPPAL